MPITWAGRNPPLLIGALCALGVVSPAAQGLSTHLAAVPELKDLAELSVEQLSAITVTSVARRSQPLSSAAAAVYVITNDDIRRSGATSLPEALRLAPNLQVARADTNQYAISARGFNNVLANKLLVMIDGRTVYSPLFSGVFWEAQQVMLEDVERIEVISGPGATLWGANAVDGVINVITKRAQDTPGALVAGGIGNRESASSLRWGGKLGQNGHYRVYGIHANRDHARLTDGTALQDAAWSGQAGFRVDWDGGAHSLTLSGDGYRNDIDQPVGGSRDLAGGHVLARWQQQRGNGSTLRVQMYYDRVERDQPGSIKERMDTWDIDAQYGFRLADKHRLLWGIGYRSRRDELDNLSPALAFIPASSRLHRGHVFLQDEIALGERIELTLGLKFEHNNYTKWEALPNARLAWRFAADRLLWGALSRAVRAPSRVDRELFAPASPPFALAGSTRFESEIADVLEIGYRAQPIPRLSYSVTAFRHEFSRLRTVEPAPGGAIIGNGMEGSLNGVETWGSFRVNPQWRLTAGYTRHRQKLALAPGIASLGGTAAAGNDPEYTWQLGTSFNVSPRHELDLRVRRVAELPSGPVPAYTAVDLRFGWQATQNFTIAFSVQNLFDPGHPEWGSAANRTEIERAAFLKLIWRL